jgi:hypothetical protein
MHIVGTKRASVMWLIVCFFQTPLLYHYLLMAADRFHHSEGRYPGCFTGCDTSPGDDALVQLTSIFMY